MADEVNGKLDKLIGIQNENTEKLDNIEKLLVGDVKDSNKIGLLERIRKVEEWIDKREWFEKIIIVAVVGNAIGLIFVLAQNALTH
jgi:hypothetical protein